jgi:2-polyprenyl-3-methyl-5-hydroxy-6-metoxy-1,4-benzoquinol methylase
MSIQSKEELEQFYDRPDPWNYSNNEADLARRARLLAVIPRRQYGHVLDIGCGNGFVTSRLPGNTITGIDISSNAISYATAIADSRTTYLQKSLFDLSHTGWTNKFDLIVITGVLYRQYIGQGLLLASVIIDDLLSPGGHLVSAHILEWYESRFPYTTMAREYYQYKEYTHVLEVYEK